MIWELGDTMATRRTTISKYQENERKKAIKLISESEIFYGGKGGKYFMRSPRDFVLLDWKNNFHKSVLEQGILDYFDKKAGNNISWWGGGEEPTGHVLSSQIACLNHLFPIRNDKNEVLKIAQIICEDITDVLEITTDKNPAYIAFEAVSEKDYLNECNGQKPTRGSLCTSIDALIYAKNEKGKKYILPIEWKYTEHYRNEDKSVEPRKSEPEGTNGKGQERLGRYCYNKKERLIDNSKQLKTLDNYKSSVYFFEPFYQLMRQTLWAEQMIANRNSEKISAEDFIHAHIIPQENSNLLNKKYPCSSGKNMETTWRECLQDQSKYKIISPKDLLAKIDPNKYADLKKYLKERY